MIIEVLKKSVFQQNDRAAEDNRRMLDDNHVVAVNIMGGAGCGKTTLLERIIPCLQPNLAVAVLEGDLATTKDAARIAALNVPVIQLLTEGGCHLTATLVEQGLKRLPLDQVDMVFIENVGNPICPVNFDLGEHFRVSVLSVTEGDDKPAKYPFLFKVADQVIFTKTDLLEATDFDREAASAAVRALNSEAEIINTARQDEEAINKIADWLRSKCNRSTRD